MKRQPWILAGSALGLLMASAPLGAYPLQGKAQHQALQHAQPIIRIQAAACPEGTPPENCPQGQKKQAPAAQQPAPAAEQPQPPKQKQAEPAQAAPAPAEQPAPAAEQPKPRKQKQAEPAQAAPAPAEQPAPAAEQPKPRKQKQADPAQAAPAPAEQPAPAAEQPKPRKKQAEPAPADKAAPAPAEQQPAAEQPQPSKKNQKPDKQAEPAPADATQPAGQATEPVSKKEKLREFLKKKKGGETAPAEEEPAEKAAPEAAPAGSENPPAKAEQPTQAWKPKPGADTAPAVDGKPADKAAPQSQQPVEQPKAGETAPADSQADGGKKQATQPELPTDTKQQALPTGDAKAQPLPKDAAPAPDSAKKGPGKGADGQATQPTGQPPAGETTQAEPPQQPSGTPEAAPQSDSGAQTAIEKIGKIESVEATQGKRVDRDQWREERRKRREARRDRNDGEVVNEVNNRIIIKFGDNIYVDNRDVNVRLEENARDSYVEELPDDFSRYTIVKENGVRIVTIRNANGDIVRRSRITPDNREIVLYYVPETYYDRIQGGYADAGADLPPLQLDISADQYILDARSAEPDDYYTYLDAPPVEAVERIYSVDEVVHSARIRDKVRRIDLDTITFDTGSADVGEDQVNKLQGLGDAINKILKDNPAETFLIEGHTDAVGSDESNLVLSDERAQAVAEALTSVFDIPAENLTTQGYGEQYLKVNTEGDNRDNRRVAVRRITPLVAPVASAQ